MINNMDMGYTTILMDQFIKDNGYKINKMVMEKKSWLTIIYMKVNLKMEKEKVKENFNGEMVKQLMRVSFIKIVLKVLVLINGLMVDNIQVNGRKIK